MNRSTPNNKCWSIQDQIRIAKRVIFPKKTKNPNLSPIEKRFGFSWFGPSGENRTHGLLNPIVLLSKTQCTIRYCLDSVSLNFKCIISFCFIGCQDVSFLLWSNCGQTTPTNDLSPPAKLHRAISIFINRSCAFCLHELSIRRDSYRKISRGGKTIRRNVLCKSPWRKQPQRRLP